VARVFEVAPNTVLQWLVEVAEHLEAFSRYVLRDVSDVEPERGAHVSSAIVATTPIAVETMPTLIVKLYKTGASPCRATG
jgi:hypothetical protein